MIIAVSGKIGSGKDTIAKIINYLIWLKYMGYIREEKPYKETKFDYYIGKESFEVKKFAGKLKDIVCLLIGCTRKQLEDPNFKNKELGEEWIRYSYATGFTKDNNGNTTMLSTQCSKEKYEEEFRTNWQTAYKTILTPRLLLQYIGTELFRNQLHENIHINALFSDYNGIQQTTISKECPRQGIHEVTEVDELQYGKIETIFPNWIVTDCRFENEAKAIKDRNGILIRVNRPNINKLIDSGINVQGTNEHPSETGLDNYKEFDYIIDNNGSIEELIEKVKQILIKEKII